MSDRAYFDDLYAQPDPFGYCNRWYERRKRAVLLAALTRPQYRSGWELGCSNGVLTAALASRCQQLLGTDVSAAALQQARQHLLAWPQVRLQQAQHPEHLPDGLFDLIVVGEMGYYLYGGQLPALAGGVQARLDEDGLLLACHWRHRFAQARCSAEQVHASLGQGLSEVLCYRDADVLLQAWARQPVSVAAHEGLR
jgi:hypothetical protein